MEKILLHIGLPKTATTTFQVDVIMPLHREGKINFLGRYKTKNYDDYYNPFEKIFFNIRDSLLNKNEILRYKKELNSMLSSNKLNVISEEGISLTHNPHIFKYTLNNLSKILEDFDVTVLLSLRNPIEFLYSYYVEMFRWYFHRNQKLDSIDKYINSLIKDPDNEIFMIHFFDRFLEYISNFFSNIKILLYEDLKNDPDNYYSIVSSLLGVNKTLIEQKFSKNIRNIRKIGEKGKKSEPINLEEFIDSRLKLVKNNKYINKVKNINLLKKLYRFAIYKLNYLPYKSIEHRFLTEIEIKKLKPILLKNNFILYEKFDLDKEKLYKYGYLL